MISIQLRQAVHRAFQIASEQDPTSIRAAIRLVLDAALSRENRVSATLHAIPGFDEVSADIPGLYEYLLHITPGNRQKSQGSFYTSPDIVRYMVSRCLEVYSESGSAVDLENIKVFDPAVGCGVFLLEVARQLAERSGMDISTVITKHLYGCDTDPIAIDITRIGLARFGDISEDNLSNIRLGDSLRENLGSYDIVIGNPPWISLKGRHRASDADSGYIQVVQERFGGDTYRPNIMESFVRMAIISLKTGGVNCFIVPDRLAANRQFASLRTKMLKDYSLRDIVYRVPFDGVLADALIYILANRPASSSISVLKWGEPDSRTQIPASDILLTPGKSIIYPGTVHEQQILRTMEAHSQPLSPCVASTATGFIAPKGAISKDQTSSNQIPVIRGRNIQPYQLEGTAYFDPDLQIIGGTSRRDILEAHPKILLRKTQDRFIAAVCDKPIWPEQSVYQIWNMKQGYSLYFLLALLNSSPALFYCRMCLLTNSHTTPQIKKLDLDRFPVPQIDFTTPADIRHQHAAKFIEYSDPDEIRTAADSEILAGRSDVVHDAIADRGLEIFSGIRKKETPRTIDILVAALYRIPYSDYRSIAGLEPVSKP